MEVELDVREELAQSLSGDEVHKNSFFSHPMQL